MLLLFQYAVKLSSGERSDLFLQFEPFQNVQNFLQELTWSQLFMGDVAVSSDNNLVPFHL